MKWLSLKPKLWAGLQDSKWKPPGCFAGNARGCAERGDATRPRSKKRGCLGSVFKHVQSAWLKESNKMTSMLKITCPSCFLFLPGGDSVNAPHLGKQEGLRPTQGCPFNQWGAPRPDFKGLAIVFLPFDGQRKLRRDTFKA